MAARMLWLGFCLLAVAWVVRCAALVFTDYELSSWSQIVAAVNSVVAMLFLAHKYRTDWR